MFPEEDVSSRHSRSRVTQQAPHPKGKREILPVFMFVGVWSTIFRLVSWVSVVILLHSSPITGKLCVWVFFYRWCRFGPRFSRVVGVFCNDIRLILLFLIWLFMLLCRRLDLWRCWFRLQRERGRLCRCVVVTTTRKKIISILLLLKEKSKRFSRIRTTSLWRAHHHRRSPPFSLF
jgi:hypothetical protein